jgi:hypothetical protein
MLDVANGPILAEKSLKNPFLVKFPKSGKTSPKKNVFTKPSRFFLGFVLQNAELNTVVKEFSTSETMPDVLHFAIDKSAAMIK